MPLGLGAYFQQPLAVGTVAPDFAALDHEDRTVRLTDLRGRAIVLIFYPGDDTRVCTAQLCDFRDRWSVAQSCSVSILGVNPQGAASHRAFAAKNSFPFPILVDRGGRIAAAYHAGGVFVRRTVYGIGSDGRIAFAERGAPEPDRVLSALAVRPAI